MRWYMSKSLDTFGGGGGERDYVSFCWRPTNFVLGAFSFASDCFGLGGGPA